MTGSRENSWTVEADPAAAGLSMELEPVSGRRMGRAEVSGFPRERAALGDLHLLRRRLEGLLADLAVVVQASEEREAWQRVEEAARLGARALAAAVGAVPPLPAAPPMPVELRVGELRVDTVARRQWYAGAEFRLSGLRHQLLARMAAEPYRVFGKDELRRDVWGLQGVVQGRTVDTAVAKLRRDLIAAGAPPGQFLVGRRGLGWALTTTTTTTTVASEPMGLVEVLAGRLPG